MLWQKGAASELRIEIPPRDQKHDGACDTSHNLAGAPASSERNDGEEKDGGPCVYDRSCRGNKHSEGTQRTINADDKTQGRA